MATKLYLESSGTPNISPTPNAGWTDQAQFARLKTSTTKQSSVMATVSVFDVLSTQADIIIGQWISDFLDVDQTITGAQAVNIVARFAEVAANNNLFLTWAVYVFNGTTLNKTVVTKRVDGTEVVATTLTSRTDSATSVAGDYTTVAGDRLVIEVGLSGDPSGSNTHDGSMSIGSDSATDLTMADGTTTANNPNVILTDTLTFNTSSPSPSVSPSVSPSGSVSPSVSPSASASPSASTSPSVSPSASVSPSSSVSPSVSPSASVSPSSSGSSSVSPSPSTSPSESVSPSASVSPSPSTSPSSSTSPSPPPPPPEIIFLDPGGDAVQAIGYFNTEFEGLDGVVSFDSSEQVVGVGSYKFDSAGDGDGVFVEVLRVLGLLGLPRRVSFYFRYDSVPDNPLSVTKFEVGAGSAYSGGGLDTLNGSNTADDGNYATATPARNAGQGSVYSSFGFNTNLPVNADIDSVKIIYERKYDTAASIGISRVKYRINSVEGPDHDDTAEPTTDTVVTVDVTADRAWERQDLLDGVFEVISEARRGDTDTAHTQSWDYVKVEVVYHIPITIFSSRTSGAQFVDIALNPKGAFAVLSLMDSAYARYDGTTELAPDTWYRISFAFVHHAVDDLDANLYVNGVQELSIVEMDTGSASFLPHLSYGWLARPGANKLCWFDQIYIDGGDDLTDPGNILVTAKLPASVNEDNWDTTVGTGAVNERPVSFTNYKQDASISDQRQTYTLQTAAVGDVDISGETLLGYMGWAIAATTDFSEEPYLALNNVQYQILDESNSPALKVLPEFTFLKQPITSASYPSHAAGIGMVSSPAGDTILVECGAVVAYEGPVEDILFTGYLLLAEVTAEVVDDLSADPPDNYTLRYWVREGGGTVLFKVYSIASEGASPQLQTVFGSSGGAGVEDIPVPGIEVRVIMEISDADTYVALQHYFD